MPTAQSSACELRICPAGGYAVDCATTLPLEVFRQRNFAADF